MGFFHKKSFTNLLHPGRAHGEASHSKNADSTRTLSMSSDASHASSTLSNARLSSYNPLSLHPPLALGASPLIATEEFEEAVYQGEEYEGEEEEEQQPHHHHQRQESSGAAAPGGLYYPHTRPASVASPAKSKRSTRVYGQKLEWSLQDWQEIPADFAAMSEADVNATTAANHHRRAPKDAGGCTDAEAFLRRGDWKRRGIVFGLDEAAEQQEMRNFELAYV